MKHILVSITCRGQLHWRLVSAQQVGKHWQISEASFQQFLDDIEQRGVHRIHVG